MPRYEPAEKRFWTKVSKSDACWMWTAGKKQAGYGSFWNGQTNVGAHRWAYVSLVGPIPDGMQLDHLCRNRACVNPEHLEPVTGPENTRRGMPGIHMREKSAAITHCPAGHAYTPENTFYERTRSGGMGKRCRCCVNARRQRRRQRRRALDGGPA